jgi:hypothetical protein
MKKSLLPFLSLAAITAADRENFQYNPTQRKVKLGRVFEPKIPSNHKYFSFKADGTFTCYEKQEPMLKSEYVFSCYALNSKNAIKKFNKFKNT